MCELLCIISFRVLFPRFIHVVACIRNLFLFTAEYGRFPRWLSGKESACQCRRHRRRGFDPWDGKISWRRKWQSTPGFLLGKSRGQRSLAGYSPWGCGETRLCTWAHTHTHMHIPLFVFPFIAWWTFGLFPSFDYCDQCCYKTKFSFFFNLKFDLLIFLLRDPRTTRKFGAAEYQVAN